MVKAGVCKTLIVGSIPTVASDRSRGTRWFLPPKPNRAQSRVISRTRRHMLDDNRPISSGPANDRHLVSAEVLMQPPQDQIHTARIVPDDRPRVADEFA